MSADSARFTIPWRPVLSGETSRQALRAVDLIAESLAPLSPDERDPSLAGGQAGLALFYAWLAGVRGDPHARGLALQCLDRAIEAVATRPMSTSLWEGFVGVAWAAELVGGLLDLNREHGNEEIDEAVARLLSRSQLWPTPHDLVTGATGVGVYALERWPHPVAVESLKLIVERLEEAAHHDEHGIYWWTPPSELGGPEVQDEYPSGLADLGVAHGVAGTIGLLGAVCAAGVECARARPLLEGAVNWLLAQAIATEAGPTFPDCVAPGLETVPVRCAWCRGDPGVAAALLCAARSVGEPAWEREAVALACRAAQRPATETGVVDAGFCHGSAGLGHLYNRMYQATGEPELGRAASYWLERTLEFCRLAEGNGDSWVQGSDDPWQGPWSGLDLVDGAAGVALVLLAATTTVEPGWDRMFLLSAPQLSQSRP